MQRRVSHRFGSLTAILNVAACIVSVVMLLSFPAVRVHSFGTHFRSPTVRRSIERHTAVAQTDDQGGDRVAPAVALPSFFTSIEPASRVVTRGDSPPFSHPPIVRLLSRRKFCPSASSGQDPLLLAA